MKILNSCPFNLSDDKIRVLWEITPRCNMNCKHCLFFSSNEKVINQELTTKQVYKIIENIAQDKDVTAIWLSGGEPLLRKDIVDICKKITSYGIVPSLSTNGILLNKKLIKELYEAGVKYIHLSIDGANASTHDTLRGVPGSFDILLSKMDLLKDSPIKTGASFMVTEESIEEMEQVLEIAKEKKLSVLSFYLVAELGRGAKNFKEDKIDLAKRLKNKIEKMKCQEIANLKIEVFRADGCGDETENEGENYKEQGVLQKCKGDHFLNITYDGKLGTCPWLMKSEEGFTVGSLLEEDFVELKNRCQTKMKEKLTKREENMKFCEDCSKKTECGKGCMALQINEKGLYLGLDPICPRLAKPKQKLEVKN